MAFQIARKTVFRAGGGIFYAEAPPRVLPDVPTQPAVPHHVYLHQRYMHPTLTFATGFPTNAVDPTRLDVANTTFIAFNPNMATPAVYHWSFSLEHQVGLFLVDANYVGTKGTHLSVNTTSINYPGAGTVAARSPIQGFNDINFTDSMGNSEYNALQMRIQRRYEAVSRCWPLSPGASRSIWAAAGCWAIWRSATFWMSDGSAGHRQRAFPSGWL